MRTTPPHAAPAVAGAALLLAAFVATGGQRALAAPPDAAPAPVRLAHLDGPSPAISEPSGVSLLAETRLFGGDERNAYTSLAAHYGLPVRGNVGAEIALRGTFARERTLRRSAFDLRHGGSDLELLAKLRPLLASAPNDFAVALGLTLPETPAQNGGVRASAQVQYRRPVAATAAVFLNTRAQFLKGNTLVGIGAGVAVRVAPGLTLLADGTTVVAGDNTYDPDNGRRRRGAGLWGIGLRYAVPDAAAGERLSVELGATNALGQTTGLSLTPGLGGASAVRLGLGYRL